MSGELGRIRQALLTVWDQQTIMGLVARGGETAWIPEGKPEHILAGIESLVARNIVQIIERVPHGLFVRLTDNGRAIAAELERRVAEAKKHVIASSGEATTGGDAA